MTQQLSSLDDSSAPMEIEDRYLLSAEQYQQAVAQSTHQLWIEQIYIDTRDFPLQLDIQGGTCLSVTLGGITIPIKDPKKQKEFTGLAHVETRGARLRKTVDENGEQHVYFTVKGPAVGNKKPEFETECADQAIYDRAKELPHVGLLKRRHVVEIANGLKAEVDASAKNTQGVPLNEVPIVAEIEYKDAADVVLPGFISPGSKLVTSPDNHALAKANTLEMVRRLVGTMATEQSRKTAL